MANFEPALDPRVMTIIGAPSPSNAVITGCVAVLSDAVSPGSSAPHTEQKLESGVLSCPQRGHGVSDIEADRSQSLIKDR